MSVPVMYYAGLVANWFFALLTAVGYFYILKKTGKKWVFMVLFSTVWVVMGLSYVFLVSGVPSGEWYITLIRVVGYVLFLAMILTAIRELAKFGKQTK